MSGVLERVLLVSGTVGVGKTTTAKTVARLLKESREPHAFLDLDAVSNAWPRHDDDPFNTRLTAENLRCVATNAVAAGARRLVLAGVVEVQPVLDLYEDAVGRAIAVVRLTARPAVIEARLRRRYGDADAEELRWHLDRAPVLDSILDTSSVPMAVVASTSSPVVVARAVLAAAGW